MSRALKPKSKSPNDQTQDSNQQPQPVHEIGQNEPFQTTATIEIESERETQF